MKFSCLLITGFFLVICFNFSQCGGNEDLIDTVATPIAAAVNKIPVGEKYYQGKVLLKTDVFYDAREYKWFWLKKGRPERIYKGFVDEVRGSMDYGLDPEDYNITKLEEAVDALYENRKRTSEEISDLDIRITASFFLFTTHLLEGRVRYPGAREFLWKRGMPLENDIALLLKMESSADLKKEIQHLHPNDSQYKRLQKALKEYRALAPLDTFPPIPARISLKPGESHEHVPVVRGKLSLLGYKLPDADSPSIYDVPLVEAVQQFQKQHGLEGHGLLDPSTAALLNIPLSQKVDVIALNLERLRWHPHIKGEGDEIVINVPEYMLRLYSNNDEKMSMRVVLGSEYTPTPVFHDTLKYIVFSPTWSVPKSIFIKEFLPKLQEDSFHFNTERFRFFKNGKEIDPGLEPWSDEDLDVRGYTVVENPGDANSLGKVKFIMPNDFSIYLHDTPAERLFKRGERALSHGCIRLENPEELAAYMLKDQKGWNEARIKEAMESGEPLQVELQEPCPVYIVYRTVWVDDEDQIHFRDDIYGHDRRHLARLTKKTIGV